MPLTALRSALLAVIWIQVVHSKLDNHSHAARIIITHNKAFKSFNITSEAMQKDLVWKLVKDPISSDIYAGGPQGLYKFNTEGLKVEQVFNFSISLLTEGEDGSPLLICKKTDQYDKCCHLNLSSELSDCFDIRNSVDIKEASLLIGSALYFTKSGDSSIEPILGLFKQDKATFTWPQSVNPTTRNYIKIIANEASEPLDGKVYSFYIEKNTNPDPETPLWVPRVSQHCMVDKGGSKNQLQFRWTSMLTTRLFCGDKRKRTTFTELLDVAVLKTPSYNTTIYALFKNEYNIRAVCAYKMSEIIRIFASSKFRDLTYDPKLIPTPGKCVEDSRTLSGQFLKFMEKRPEMEEWIEPENLPLLISHREYSHLQVDRVNSHNVLLMTKDNGKIHKVLVEETGHFIIAEYQPFINKTHIHSTLLDRSNRKLYVSSSSQVVQIDLQDCSCYGEKCETCAQARDPYCSWNGLECSPAASSMAALRTESNTVCGEGSVKARVFRPPPPLVVPQGSKYYLKCPTNSQYASYAWTHDGNPRESVSTDQDCLLLIESMSKNDEGLYECRVSENNQSWTISSYRMVTSGSALRVAPAGLVWILLLMCLI